MPTKSVYLAQIERIAFMKEIFAAVTFGVLQNPQLWTLIYVGPEMLRYHLESIKASSEQILEV